MTNDEKQLLQIRAMFPGIEILSDEEGDYYWVWRGADSRCDGHYFASPVAALTHFSWYLQGIYDELSTKTSTTIYLDAF